MIMYVGQPNSIAIKYISRFALREAVVITVLVIIIKIILLSAENDLNDVCQEVVGIKSTYYQFGIALGLPAGELDSIRRAFHQVID